MDNYKKILIVLSGIIILLTIGIISELNYKNKSKIKSDNIPVKEIKVHKNEVKDDEIAPNEELETINEVKENKEEVIEQTNNIQEKQEMYIYEEEQPIQSNIQVTLTEKEIIQRKTDSLGTAGRLYIPNVNISVGLNNANIYDNSGYNAQDIVNREDSAAYYYFGSKLVIADHDYQGFSRIGNIKWDDKAFIKSYDGSVEEYQMIDKFVGHNIGTDLTDLNNNSIKNMNGSLIMYTCYGTGDSIMITLWNKIA